ncbi:hypothetical protein D3C73_1167840 [compost metagenome]
MPFIEVGCLLAQKYLKGTKECGIDAQVYKHHARDPDRPNTGDGFGERRSCPTSDYNRIRHRTRQVGQAHGRFPLISTFGFSLARRSDTEPPSGFLST